jgi:hypothetical protein
MYEDHQNRISYKNYRDEFYKWSGGSDMVDHDTLLRIVTDEHSKENKQSSEEEMAEFKR